MRNDHAVVLGAGVGGLLAARVLSDFYDRVTVVERDGIDALGAGRGRKGVPQGRHGHALQPRGAQILEELFPGILDELVAGGVPTVTDLSQVHFSAGGHLFCQDPCPMGVSLYQTSRPNLERHLHRRVTALPKVTVLDAHEALGLAAHDSARVTGARITPAAGGGPDSVLEADLVVDATGRGGRMGRWLADLGYPPAPDHRVVVDVKYASRHLRITPAAMTREKVVLVGATSDRPTALALFPQEGDRYILTLGGYPAHHPPSGEDEFLAFARAMLPEHIYPAVHDAEPLDDIVTNRYLASARRRYDRIRTFPDGLLVFGDAMCSLNPLYGQGMTVAALQAIALRDTLTAGHTRLASRFFRAATKPTALAWQLSAPNDLALPQVEGRPSRSARIAARLGEYLLAAAERDSLITEQFLRVAGFLDPPATLASPRILRRLLAH